MNVYKINVDAFIYPGYWGIGVVGVIRDHLGIVHRALLKQYSGENPIEVVELLAIWDGVHFPINKGFRKIFVESDAISIVNSIRTKDLPSCFGSIICEVLDLFNSIGGDSCQVIHISGNKVAHTH